MPGFLPISGKRNLSAQSNKNVRENIGWVRKLSPFPQESLSNAQYSKARRNVLEIGDKNEEVQWRVSITYNGDAVTELGIHRRRGGI